MTIRGGGDPRRPWLLGRFENGPAARSFAADAHGCIMVRILRGSTEYKVAAEPRADGELPSDPIGLAVAGQLARAWPAKNPASLAAAKAPADLLEGLWVCGRSAVPTDCALPAFRAKLEKPGECSPSPTYPQAQQTTTGSIDDKLDPPPPPPPAPTRAGIKPLDIKSPIQGWVGEGLPLKSSV